MEEQKSNITYIANGNKMATLISNHIYNPITAIVELVADYYDADATEVSVKLIEQEIDGTVYITKIILEGNGEGFSYKDFESLNVIGSSNKEKDLYTKKFNRTKLGSFGIAFTSSLTLGKQISIYSKPGIGKNLFRKIAVDNDGGAFFSNIEKLESSTMIEYDTGCTIIIDHCNILKSVFSGLDNKSKDFELLKNELLFLPINEKFKIKLNDEAIKSIILDNNCYKKSIKFKIENIDFEGNVFYFEKPIDNNFARGIFLKINERIINWNIYPIIRGDISTPGSVDTRIHGCITANDLRNRINASRTGLIDSNLSLKIAENIKKSITHIYRDSKSYYSKRKGQAPITMHSENKNNERKAYVGARLQNCNSDLERLGIKFCYGPESETEVIVLASQLCQMGLLDFDILQIISNDSPDAIIIKDGKVAFLEFELSLNNFYCHNHNPYDIDYILCWDVNEKDLRKQCQKYVNSFSKYVQTIDIINPDEELCDYKIVYKNCDNTEHTINVYVLSELIKRI